MLDARSVTASGRNGLVEAGEDTITNVLNDAMPETGITIVVPVFVEMGERVRVDTRTGQFFECVS